MLIISEIQVACSEAFMKYIFHSVCELPGFQVMQTEHVKALNKMITILLSAFQTHFRRRIYLYLDSNFTKNCVIKSPVVNWWLWALWDYNMGLWAQAIIWRLLSAMPLPEPRLTNISCFPFCFYVKKAQSHRYVNIVDEHVPSKKIT